MNKRKENCKKYKFVFQDLIVFQRTPCHDSFAKCVSYHLCSKCLHQIRISNHAEICAFRKKKKEREKKKLLKYCYIFFGIVPVSKPIIKPFTVTIAHFNITLTHVTLF